METSNPSSNASGSGTAIRVWDLPLRLFHWGFVLTVIGSFATVKLGGLWMDWHVRFGLAAFALIVFRVVWGLVGPRYARFSQFAYSPRTVLRYLRGEHQHSVGHNPLGSWAVIALLLIFGFQAASGLFADDDIFTTGPLAYLSSAWSATLTTLHKRNEWIMIAMVSLHVLTIIWYRLVRGKNLTGPMLHGDVRLDAPPATIIPARDGWDVRLAALLLAIAIGMATWWLTTLAPAGGEMSFM